MPSIDPFSYDSVTFNYKNSELLVGSFNLKDVKTYGMSRGKVESVKSEFTDDEMTIQADLFFPKLFSTGSYKSNMTLNLFKLNSKGQYNITLKEVKAKWNIKGKLEKDDDGELYMKIYKFDILPEANDMQISVSGLFPDEKLSELLKAVWQLNPSNQNEFSDKVVNDFFNQYWRLLYKEMIPETRKQWEPILLDIINKFFAQVPFRRLLIKE